MVRLNSEKQGIPMKVLRLTLVIFATFGCSAKKSIEQPYPEGKAEQILAECIKSGGTKSQCDCAVKTIQANSSWSEIKQGAIKKQRGVYSNSYEKIIETAKIQCESSSEHKSSFIDACQKTAPVKYCACIWKDIEPNLALPSEAKKMNTKHVQDALSAAALNCKNKINITDEFLKQCRSTGQSDEFCDCFYTGLESKTGKKAIGEMLFQWPWESSNPKLSDAAKAVHTSCQ